MKKKAYFYNHKLTKLTKKKSSFFSFFYECKKSYMKDLRNQFLYFKDKNT